jgi:WD40 repeat protein
VIVPLASLFIFHQRVSCVCALPDGHRVVSGSHDKTLRVWDVETGSCERVLEGHGEESEIKFFSLDQIFSIFHGIVSCVCVLPDGHRVVSGSDNNTFRVWNVETGSCESVWDGRATVGTFLCLCFTLPLRCPFLVPVP